MSDKKTPPIDHKAALIEKIKKGEYSQQQLLSWISALPGSTTRVKPTDFQKGDVLMHPVFKHPYVLLEKKKDYWICGLLTTETECEEILLKCESRFFPDSYFTRVIFTSAEPIGTWMNTYDNTKHIRVVLNNLKSIFK
jgi:hypothetical protein